MFYEKLTKLHDNSRNKYLTWQEKERNNIVVPTIIVKNDLKRHDSAKVM